MSTIERSTLTNVRGLLLTMLLVAAPLAVDAVELSFQEGTNHAVTVAPDGTEMVLELQGLLWRLPIGGGVAERLSEPALGPARPAWSPVEPRIVFQAYQGGTFDIWTLRLDGSAPVQHTDGPWDEREPTWAPDGRRVAFASDRSGESYDIWVLDLATGEYTQWTNAASEEAYPVWSPDGREIAYVVDNTVLATDAAGNTRTLATDEVGGVRSPAWLADGEGVMWIRTTPGKAELVVNGEVAGVSSDVFPFRPQYVSETEVIYTADGGIRRHDLQSGAVSPIPFTADLTIDRPEFTPRLERVGDFDAGAVKGIVTPAISPDGEQVAFVALNDLWIMSIGETPTRVTHDLAYESDPAWSPDGESLAFLSDRDGDPDLYIVTLADGMMRRIAIDGAELYPAWSPDGQRIAYHDQDGVTHVLEVATGVTRVVADAAFQPGRPSWSADGSRLVYAAVVPYTTRFREGTSQFRVVDLETGATRHVAPAPNKSVTSRGDNGPVWSPDGTAMAFVMDGFLHVAPVNSTGDLTGPPVAITDELAESPTWNGSSSRLLYLANGELRLIGRDGGEAETVPLPLDWRSEVDSELSLIRAGRLWDGTGAMPRADQDLLVVGDRIRWIGDRNERLHELVSRVGTVIDASDETVLPGLIEMHTHQTWGNHTYGYAGRQGPLLLAYGITSTHSVGDLAYRAVADREALASGARLGPRFFATGEPLDGDRIYYNAMRPMGSDRQFELELERAVALGYDSLKTYVRLGPARMGEAAETAHAIGVNVWSHFLSPGVLVGQDGTTHLGATERLDYSRIASLAGRSYEDVITLFADAGMAVMSTFFVAEPSLFTGAEHILDDNRVQRLVPWWEQQKLAGEEGVFDVPPTSTFVATLPDKAETFARIYRRGGRVLAGTDSPLDTVGVGLHNNLRWLARGGLTPEEVLATTTRFAAEQLGIAADLGTVEAGKLADLAFVDGRPEVDVNDLIRTTRVMVGGRLYTREELVERYPVSTTPAEIARRAATRPPRPAHVH